MQLRPSRNRRRRPRPGRLTPSGRLVVAAVALLLGWSGGLAWQRGASAPSAAALPAVSAAPPTALRPPEGALAPPLSRDRFGLARQHAAEIDPSAVPRLVEWLDARGRPASPPPTGLTAARTPFRVEYSLDEALTAEVFEILRKARVARGHAIVLDPRSGRLLAYVSTDPETFPPDRAYPAASIVKVITAAAMLEKGVAHDAPSCVYRGNQYRLHWRRLDRPRSGRNTTLEQALASSNNQCFSQWALHDLGEGRLVQTLERFGWLDPPAPGHEAGRLDPIETKLDLGRLGSGLDGLRVTPLHVATLASVLTHGRWVEPWWIDRLVDAEERSIPRAAPRVSRRVLSPERAEALRSMMVATTLRGTAKSAFRSRRGRPLLGDVRVAGKTGNVTGSDPFGRYEWFLGLAPAEQPRIAVVVLQLQSNLWWTRSTEIAARILQSVFCDRAGCRAERSNRFTGELGEDAGPILISDLARARVRAQPPTE